MSMITFIMMLIAGASTEFLKDAPSTIPYLWVANFVAGTAVYAAGLLMHPPTSMAALSQLMPGSKPAAPVPSPVSTELAVTAEDRKEAREDRADLAAPVPPMAKAK